MATTPRQRPVPGTSKSAMAGRFALLGEFASNELVTTHIGRGPGADGTDKLVVVEKLASSFAKNRTIASAIATSVRPLTRLRHDNVVPVLDVLDGNGELAVVTGYVEGLSVAEAIQTLSERGEQLPLDIALRILVDLLRGLHAANEATDERGRAAPVTHGSIDPAAVIVGVDGVARVRGFALARAVRRQQSRDRKGAQSGTSPEEIAGDPVDHRADLFSAGALAWQCMVGRPLFDATEEAALAEQIAHANLDPPSMHNVFVPRPCDEAIMRGLERDPARRWGTAAEMADALQAAAVVATPGRMGKWLGRVGGTLLVDRARRVATLSSAAQPQPATATGAPPLAPKPAAAAGAAVPKATPPPAPSTPKMTVPKAVAPPQAAARPPADRRTSEPERAGQNADAAPAAPPRDDAPRGPVVVVEDESPTIGTVTRASEGATNFQAATTQRLVASPAGKGPPKPGAPAVKVALHLDEPPAAPSPAAATMGPESQRAIGEKVPAVAPDELPTIEARLGGPASVPGSPQRLPGAAAPAASQPELPPRESFDELPTIEASLDGASGSAARESFDEAPTIEAMREPPAATGATGADHALGPDGAPAPKRRVGAWLAALAAAAGIAIAAVWLTSSGGAGASAASGPSADPVATGAQAAVASDPEEAQNHGAAGGNAAEGESPTAESSASSEAADSAPSSDATTEAAEPKAVAAAATTNARTTSPPRAAPAAPPPPPPAARPASTGGKAKPAAKPKSEDDLFSRK